MIYCKKHDTHGGCPECWEERLAGARKYDVSGLQLGDRVVRACGRCTKEHEFIVCYVDRYDGRRIGEALGCEDRVPGSTWTQHLHRDYPGRGLKK